MVGPHEHSAVRGSPHHHRSAQIQRSRPLSSSLDAHDHSPCANPPPSCASSASKPASHPSLLPLPSFLHPFSCSSGLGQCMLLCPSIHPSIPTLTDVPPVLCAALAATAWCEWTPGPGGADAGALRWGHRGLEGPREADAGARSREHWHPEGQTPEPRGLDTRAWKGPEG